ncbi:MAG: metalloregulator ArsR/SmtB family transcription factor [Candidatus Pacearchaeota archaeon]
MNNRTYHIFFSKLANPLRISIISSLDKNPKSVSELIKELKIEQSKLSHALGELKECNIVGFEQKGKQRIYSLSSTIKPILRMIDVHSKGCCKAKCAECKGCK